MGNNMGFAASSLEKGNIHLDLGEYEAAIECFKDAIKENSALVDAWIYMGVAYQKLGNYDNAIECYDTVIGLKSLTKEQYGEAWNNKGNSLARKNNFEEAINCYDNAIIRDSSNPSIYYNKALALDRLEKLEDAIGNFQKAIELGVDSASIHISIAKSYKKLGQSFEANHNGHCKNACKMINYESEYNRACFEAVCGSPAAALELLRTALEKKQVPADWARRDPDFEFIRDDPRFAALLDEFSPRAEMGPK